MRWIFFVLLGANLLLLGWQLLGPGPEQAPARDVPRQPESVPGLALLSETASNPPKNSAGSAPPSTRGDSVGSQPGGEGEGQPSAPAALLDDRLCTFVGPYEQVGEAAALVERLAAMDVGGAVAEVEIPTGPGYWVYIEPFQSRREALRKLTELQGQGVDSYIIPRGELMHGISLGMFSREALAHARVREMAELGVDAKIDVIERSHKEIWVSIPAAEARRLGDPAWDRLLGSSKSIDRRQNFCLHVASQDNIH